MINRVGANISEFVVHLLDTTADSKSIHYSKSLLELSDDEEKSILLKNCIDGYKEPFYFQFQNLSFSENQNIIWQNCQKVFDGENTLYEASIPISKYLFNKIQLKECHASYFMFCKINDILVDDELIDAIALVRYESKEQFIRFDQQNGIFKLNMEAGYLLSKFDQACLILNQNHENGFKILNHNRDLKSEVGKIWNEEFLQMIPLGNDYTYTTDYIKITSGFLKNKKLVNDLIDKTEEGSILNRSFDYFKNNKKFEEDDYKSEVLQDKKVINAFDQYKESWQEKSNKPLTSTFDVSEFALNKQSKVFRSVIKLDRNFHIYVHGDQTKIMKGVDDEGKKYYILYYNEES